MRSPRLLGPEGFATHLINPSDHFAHQDPRITRINFLRFSPGQWRRIGGNEFSYCNRLRASQLEQAFTTAGFHIERSDRTVDEPSRGHWIADSRCTRTSGASPRPTCARPSSRYTRGRPQRPARQR